MPFSFSSLGTLYLRFPFLMSALVPSLLTILGIASLSLKPTEPGFSLPLALSLAAYAGLLIVKTAVDYSNAQKSIQLTRRSASLEAQIEGLDKVVKKKCAAMTEAVRSSNDGYELLRRARGKLKFDRSASVLTEQVCESIIAYLSSIDRVNGANFVCKLIAPIDNGEFHVIGDWHITGGTRTPNRETGLNLDMDNCLASRVWKDRGKTVSSISDTIAAEADGSFIFVHDSQRENLRSICCFQIGDESTGVPVGIWSIDADQPGVFPSANEDILLEINKIFSSFALRLSLETVYSEILEDTESIYEEAISRYRR